MLFNSHYWLTMFMLQEAGWDPDYCIWVATANYLVDWATPINVNHYQHKPKSPLIPITQCYSYLWYIPKAKSDPRDMIWTRWHFGGKLALQSGKPCQQMNFQESECLLYFRMFEKHQDPMTACALGICMHTWQDSYSHQDFYGFRHDYNSANKIWDPLIPNIGHAEYFKEPDKPLATWKRHGKTIHNINRWISMLKDFEAYTGYSMQIIISLLKTHQIHWQHFIKKPQKFSPDTFPGFLKIWSTTVYELW